MDAFPLRTASASWDIPPGSQAVSPADSILASFGIAPRSSAGSGKEKGSGEHPGCDETETPRPGEEIKIYVFFSMILHMVFSPWDMLYGLEMSSPPTQFSSGTDFIRGRNSLQPQEGALLGLGLQLLSEVAEFIAANQLPLQASPSLQPKNNSFCTISSDPLVDGTN